MLDVSLEVLAATCARRVAGDKLEEASEALRNAQEARADLEQKVKELKAQKSQYHKQFLAEKRKAEHVAPRWIDDDQSNLTEFGEKYSELPDNVLQLDAVIEDLTEDLSGSVHNPQVIKKYQKLKEETETARKALSELVEGNLNANERMNSIRTPWKEKLQDMVAQLNELFREYMSKMDGCGGEVRLAEDESSFKKWGIEIRVRFRSEADGGKMAVLNARVHSGGERSVSTILFLMALQDLQHSPFRVVDEINQGMDPKNERQVFSRIVLNSCGPSRKQYFLITPKLLQGLVAMDNDDITVIVIMNGVNTIKGTEEHSMQKFIAAKKRQRALKDGDAQGNGPQQRRRIS
ncbi:conserved unknown protein [Ectocarpus siliculosus]|uniref:Structural maintenance of chromosomes protein 5 n=1 Tax=Ectocarpus siliculosus TaxID=2880 RepID=D7FWM4_ECTSI|nr:conserved unknown protein [Ectocarpus siliculosus]|eukprot:CBJ32112.1 conserved unknown protein [Ectocarpus siliculosus]